MRRLTAIIAALLLQVVMCGCAETQTEEPESVSETETTAEAATTAASTTTTTEVTTTEQTTTTATTVQTEATKIVEIPDTPQTDTETQTETVTGSVAMTNGIMVVDSGTEYARALEIFSGSFKTGTRYAGILNAYKAELGETVNVFCMVIPTSAAYYMPEEEAVKYGSQLDNYNNIAESLDGVIGVPVYSAIAEHTDQYLYSRTDYHWQPLGAYYAGAEFAQIAGVPYAELSDYTAVVREGYVGAFYAVNDVEELLNAPDTFTYYKPSNLSDITCTYYQTDYTGAREGRLFYEDNSIGASYTVFVGTDDTILHVKTNAENERVLVIFKDSYGNALVPFLTQSFSDIYLCDFRYFDLNAADFIREVGATDLLFAMSTVAITTSSKIRQVENNLWK